MTVTRKRSWITTAIWVTSIASLLPLLWFVGERAEPREHLIPGLSPWWLVFGFTAQALFAGRLIVQWLATEKKRESVVPVSFWWLSLIGGLMLLVYFWRRGDPVGIAGQLFGNVVYVRNLYFLYIARHPQVEGEDMPTAGTASLSGRSMTSSRRLAMLPREASSRGEFGAIGPRGPNSAPSTSAEAARPAQPLHSRQRQ